MWRESAFKAERFRLRTKRYMLVDGRLYPILDE